MRTFLSLLLLTCVTKPHYMLTDIPSPTSEEHCFEPNNEPNESEALSTFLTDLDHFTFNTKVVVGCNGQQKDCSVNPRGKLVWQFRDELYQHFNKYYNTSDSTLDKCFCETKEVTAFSECMENMRNKMNGYLQEHGKLFIKKAIEKDSCYLFEEECIHNTTVHAE